MPRSPRRYADSATYHVFARANDRRRLFRDRHDYELLLEYLGRAVSKFGLRLYAWCLLGNHFHTVLAVPQPTDVSRVFHWVNFMYARAFNSRHGRAGHLFNKPYGSTAITTDPQLVAACRYVLNNPVNHGFCDTLDHWQWSSFRASAGLERPRPHLSCDALHDLLGIRRRNDAYARLHAFVATDE